MRLPLRHKHDSEILRLAAITPSSASGYAGGYQNGISPFGLQVA